MKHDFLEPRFVKAVPRDIEPGVLYVSMEYGTVVHSCCCGCGFEVVTPLTPTDWCLTFDGESVSLWPSVGSWYLPCQSHYVIEKNRVRVAPRWSKSRIESEHARDSSAKAQFYSEPDAGPGSVDATGIPPQSSSTDALPDEPTAKRRWWQFW